MGRESKSVGVVLRLLLTLVLWSGTTGVALAADAPLPEPPAVAVDLYVGGLVLDAIGGGLGLSGIFLIGHPGNHMFLAYFGMGFAAIGSILGSTSWTLRQRALTKTGRVVAPGPMVAAWILTAASVASFAGCLPVFIQGANDERAEAIWIGLGMWLASGLLEAADVLVIREGMWRAALDASSAPAPEPAGVSLAPVVVPIANPGGQGWTPTFGLAARF